MLPLLLLFPALQHLIFDGKTQVERLIAVPAGGHFTVAGASLLQTDTGIRGDFKHHDDGIGGPRKEALQR